MEQSLKYTDCYFYCYSKCKKRDTCPYRHEPLSLGCETICPLWQQNNCFNLQCNLRHLDMKKNRKTIPCYWENQPSGCMKPHCPFLHRNERPALENTPSNQGKAPEAIPAKPANQEWSTTRQEDSKFDGSSTESDQGRGSSEAGSFIGSSVDSVIVNFDEESDSEDAVPPVKQPSPVRPKRSLPAGEQKMFEAVQAEVSIFYGVSQYVKLQQRTVKMKTHPSFQRKLPVSSQLKWKKSTPVDSKSDLSKIKIFSAEELSQRKAAKLAAARKLEAEKKLEAAKQHFTKNLEAVKLEATRRVKAAKLETSRSLGGKTKQKDSTQNSLKTRKNTVGVKTVSIEKKNVNDKRVMDFNHMEEKPAKIAKVQENKVPPVKLQRVFHLSRNDDIDDEINVLDTIDSALSSNLDSQLSLVTTNSFSGKNRLPLF